MGEVLENGVYLPDEGERNAYNGLKGNWNTVDTVVAQVQALSSTGLIRKPVDELPTEDIETNVIYMLKAVKPNGDVYRIEYMYIDGHWDALGTSETTLDDYYTKTETDDLPAVKSGINATKVSNYDAHLANNDVHVTLANKQSWDGKQNALDTAQTAAVNSGVTATKVTGYDTHVSDTDIHVTTSDKTAWNAKQDGLSQTQLAAVNSGVTSAKVTGYDNHVADTDVHVTTADKAAWNGKQNALTQTQLNNIAAVPDKADSADLATVATTGDYGDLLNAPTIPTVNNATLTIQKNGADVATFTANASSNVTANLAIPVNTSDLNNDAGFLTQHNPIDNELSATSENALQNKVINTELNGKAPLVHAHAASDITSGTFNIARIPNLDASKITSGTIDIARLPKGALERLVKVANQAARYALTTDDVQLGDTVQQLDTGVMYVVTDETKLDSADGYTEFTAGAASSVPWTGVTGKPNDYPPSSHTHTKSQITDFPSLATVATSGSYNDLNNIPASFTPSSHTHGNITNDGKLDTASRALVTDANKNIVVSSVTATELGYVSGVTSAIQTQIAGKAPAVHTHTKSDITDFPVYGNTAGTICEGNDSRLSDARTPVAHTHGKADITDLFNSANTWTALNSYNQSIQITVNFSIGVAPSSDVYGGFNFGNGSTNIGNVTARVSSAGITYSRLYVSNKYANGALDPNGTLANVELQVGLKANGKRFIYSNASWDNSLVPYANNTYDLGSSSYQWNNLYAKNYYYNGVAWGLDKANVWTDINTFQSNLYHKSSISTLVKGTNPSSITYYGAFRHQTYAGEEINLFRGYIGTTGDNCFRWTVEPWVSGSNGRFQMRVSSDGSVRAFEVDGTEVSPLTNNATNLGTSTNKWKSVWFNNLQDIATDTVEWHNSHYRGINLISTGHFANMAALLTAIRAQDWSDIYIGDYVKLTFTYEGASRTVKFYVGEIDKFYKVGNTSLETHHLVMVTGDLGINQVMNDSNTTAGGYVGSKAHTVTLPALYAILNPLFNNAILTHKEHLSNTVLSAQTVSLSLDDGNGAVTYSCNNFPVYSSGDPNTPGCVTAGNWYDCNLVLMSEIEMFGSNRFASSGIDDIMCPEGQIAAFKYNRNLQTLNRTINTWLRNVNSASRFCYCSNFGRSNRHDASIATLIRLRPRFLIG